MKLYFKELDFKELGVLGYSDLLGLGVPDELLLDLLVERPWLNGLGPHGAGDHMGPMGDIVGKHVSIFLATDDDFHGFSLFFHGFSLFFHCFS